jgi:Domain of unknown function (DUF6457)
MNTLEAWVETVRRELGIEPAVDRDLILDVTKEVAHNVARPAAPLTAYLLGLAIGAGADPAAVAARITELARGWAPEPPTES